MTLKTTLNSRVTNIRPIRPLKKPPPTGMKTGMPNPKPKPPKGEKPKGLNTGGEATTCVCTQRRRRGERPNADLRCWTHCTNTTGAKFKQSHYHLPENMVPEKSPT